MKAARLVVLGVAVAAGGIAAYLAAGSKSPPPPPPAAPVAQLETVEVLVAKSDLIARPSDRAIRISAGRPGRRPRPIPNFIKKSDRPERRSTNSPAPSCACRCSRAIRFATLCRHGQGFGLHGRGAAEGHARGRDRNLAGVRRRRVHPARRSRRRHADAPRQGGESGDRRREISPAKQSCTTSGCWRWTRQSTKRPAPRSASARPRRSN